MMHIKSFNESKIYNCSNPECDNKIDSKPEENKCPVCGENVIEKDTITRNRRNINSYGYNDYGDYNQHKLEGELEYIQYMISDCLEREEYDRAKNYYDRFRELKDIYNHGFLYRR